MIGFASMHRPVRVQAPIVGLILAVLCADLVAVLAILRAQIPSLVIVAGVIAFAIALARPRIAYAAVTVTLILIPVYASPKFGPLHLEPTAVGMWITAFALVIRQGTRGRLPRPGYIDLAVLTLVLLLGLTLVFSVQEKAAFIQASFLWLGPYIATRLLLNEEADPAWLLKLLILTTLAGVPIILLEFVTGTNPFFSLSLDSGSSEIWGISQIRFGADRVEGAFGHSIAAAMFFATALVACLGVLLHEHRRISGSPWVVAGLVLLPALAMTVSRTGYLLLTVGVLMLAWVAGGVARRRMSIALVCIALLVAGMSQIAPPEIQSPVELATSSSNQLDASTRHREGLLQAAMRPGALEPWGPSDVPLAYHVDPENPSIDNAYLAIAGGWGILPALGLVLVALCVLVATLRARRERYGAVLLAATTANLAALLGVAFITQQQILIWMLVGACAALVAPTRPFPALPFGAGRNLLDGGRVSKP